MPESKLRVVWLCHLNNADISKQLGIKNQFEFAPWMSRFAEIFAKFDLIDVHIVSPHAGIFRSKTYNQNNICYHFFPYMIPHIRPKRLFHLFHLYTNYFCIKLIIKSIINKIKPDLIHMFGTENAYFTSSILQFKDKYPVFITIQGFASLISKNNCQIRKRKKIEIEIIENFQNFGVRDEIMKSFLKEVNPNVKFYHHEMATYLPKLKVNQNEKKNFDIIFFATLTKDKGIEDLLKATSIIKKKKSDISVCLVGPVKESYIQYLKSLSKDLKIQDNIFFKGTFMDIDDVHKLAVQSYLTVLPTHADTIPGTIIESMIMGIPCVSYAVGGIPSLNNTEEVIKLVKKGDIEGLANAIHFLLINKNIANKMAVKASEYVMNRWNDKVIFQSIIDAYRQILEC